MEKWLLQTEWLLIETAFVSNEFTASDLYPFCRKSCKNIFPFKDFKRMYSPVCLVPICIWPSTGWMEKLQHAEKDVIWPDHFNVMAYTNAQG